MADYISQITLPNNTSYNIKDAKASIRGIEYIRGTWSGASGTWTGKSEDEELYDGKQILLYMPYAGSGNATLNLTLADGSTTGAKNVYFESTTRFTTHKGAYSQLHLIYHVNHNINGTNYTGWWYIANRDRNDNTLLRTYALNNNAERPLIAQVSSSAGAWTHYTSSYKDWYGAIPNDSSKCATINLSTGTITVPGGIIGTASNANTVNNLTVQTAVPANAVFTDHYDWDDITNKPTTLSGYGITDAKIASNIITLGSNTIKPVVTVNGYEGPNITLAASDFNLSAALRFIGKVASNSSYTPSDDTNTTSKPTITGVSNYTPIVGDVVLDKDSDSEYVCIAVNNGTYTWERLGRDGSWAYSNHVHGNITNDGKIGTTTDLAVYTTTGGAVTAGTLAQNDPTANGTSTTFISTITQDSKGAISATKATLPNYAASSSLGGAATTVAVTDHTNTTNGNTTYYPWFSTDISGSLYAKAHTGLYLNETVSSGAINNFSLGLGTSSISGKLILHDGSNNTATLLTTALSEDRTFTLPNKTGTFALTSDIDALSSVYYALNGSNTGTKLCISAATNGYTNCIQFLDTANSNTVKAIIGAGTNGTVGLYGTKIVLSPSTANETNGLAIDTGGLSTLTTTAKNGETAFQITSTGTINNNKTLASIRAYDSNMAVTSYNIISIGKSPTSGNSATFGFAYVDSTTVNNNYATIGVYGTSHIIKAYGSGQVEITSETDVSSNSDGALLVDGGLTVEKKIYANSTLTIANKVTLQWNTTDQSLDFVFI